MITTRINRVFLLIAAFCLLLNSVGLSFTTSQFKNPVKKSLSTKAQQAEKTSGIYTSLDGDTDFRFEAEETETDNEDAGDGNPLFVFDFQLPKVVIEFESLLIRKQGYFYQSQAHLPLFIQFRNLRI